jgi:hypothetical protein
MKIGLRELHSFLTKKLPPKLLGITRNLKS